MKFIFKNLFILITGILITGTILFFACSQIILNKEEVKSVISKSDIYTRMNEESKKLAIKALNEALAEVDSKYRTEIPVEELVNSVDISDLFELLTNEIIDLAYSKDPREISIDYLTNRYIDKIDSYLEVKNIKLPEDVKNSIHESLGEESLKELVDTSEVEKSLKDVQDIHEKAEVAVNEILIILIIASAVPTLLIIIFCKKKIKEIIKLLFIPTLLLIGFELFIRTAEKTATGELGELLVSLVESTIGLAFDKIHMFIVAMVVIMIILIIIKILTTKTKKEMISEN